MDKEVRRRIVEIIRRDRSSAPRGASEQEPLLSGNHGDIAGSQKSSENRDMFNDGRKKHSSVNADSKGNDNNNCLYMYMYVMCTYGSCSSSFLQCICTLDWWSID